MIINEFITKYLVADNCHNDILHAIIHIKINPKSAIEMLSNLVSFNREVLCEYKQANAVVEINLMKKDFFSLWNTCDEDVLQKIILNNKDVDPEDYLVKQTAQTFYWFKREGKWSYWV